MPIAYVLSTEIVKTTSPTPDEQKTYQLCLLDQLCPLTYISLVLSYPSPGKEFGKNVDDHLKTSLSKTLSHFYPFAGRFRDACSVDCNDHGVGYVRAQVNSDPPSILSILEVDCLQKLLPCSPLEKSADISDQLILPVQANVLSCGGLVIGVCIWHSLANAAALASLVTNWAAVARGASRDLNSVVLDCTSLFPPQDLGGFSTGQYLDRYLPSSLVTKRFVLKDFKIASLREKIGTITPFLDHPTRVRVCCEIRVNFYQ